MKVIGIDIGSSYLKVSLIDMENGEIIKKNKSPAPKCFGTDKRFEIKVYDYVQFARDVIDEYASTYDDLSGVLLATQMHGFVYSTSEDVQMDRYISWQDMRCLEEKEDGQTYLAYLQELISEVDMEPCGVMLKPSLGSCNLFTMLAQNPDIPVNGRLYTIGSYIIEKLTGCNVCHPSNAAPLGILNVRDMRWEQKILEKLGFSEMSLPKLASDDYQPCGIYSVNGLNIPIFPDYGDQQVAILGCMPQKGDGVVNIATACQVSVITDQFISGEYELRPYFEGTLLNTISNMPAGRGLDVLIEFMKEIVYRFTGTVLSTAKAWEEIRTGFYKDAQGLQVDMSFYATPKKMDGGRISHITQSNLCINSLISAALSDMAQTYKEHFDILQMQVPVDSIICSGGVSWKLPELVDTIKFVTGLPCRLSPMEDEVLAGLYRAALCCMNINKSMWDNPNLILKQ